MPPLTLQDVLLPKCITDSCYASITQIYCDMFELSPKSNLKQSSNSKSLLFRTSSNQQKYYPNSATHDHDVIIADMFQDRGRPTRILSLGSLKKSSSANLNNYHYGDKDMRRSERKFDKNYNHNGSGAAGKAVSFRKGNKMRASWHEGDSKRAVVGTKIEFVTRF